MKTNFKMYHDDVRTVCIKNNWCTRCDCNEYLSLLEKCDFECKSFPTLQNKLLEIAKLIYVYSDLNEYENTCENIENIMFQLMKKCVNTFFELGV